MLASILIVELAKHGPLPMPYAVNVTLLIATLAAIAFVAFTGGLAVGVVSAFFVGAYTVHWLSPHESLIVLSGANVQGGVIMLVIGLVIATVVGLLKRRADAAAEAALRLEREYAASLREANARLAQANEALEAFTYLVSHDLKEPVRSTEMLLEFLDKDHGAMMPEDARDLLRRARRANQRLSVLLASLLELSRASRIDAREATPVHVHDALVSEQGRLGYEAVAEERGATVEVDVKDARPVLATPSAVQQVFGNLIANAVRHNPSQAPRVRVRRVASAHGGGFESFVIEDDGPGFPKSFLERFQRGEALPSSTKDGGFGLIIARRAVARLGGQFELARSDVLGGAAVIVDLPVAEAIVP